MQSLLVCQCCKENVDDLHRCPSCSILVCSGCHDAKDPDPRCMCCLENDANACHYDAYGDDS